MSRLSYRRYLQLDRLLSSQALESVKAGRPAHDEHLFIVVHQAYELWFKQILHELDAVLAILERDFVASRELARALRYLDRIAAVQKLLLAQIDVLETMAPLDFLEFRDLLTPSSGFQSAQFRSIENKLGLRRSERLVYNEQPYDAQFETAERAPVLAAESSPTLFDAVDRWLGRMPFVHWRTFDFWQAYQDNVRSMLAADEETITAKANLSTAARRLQLEELERTRATFTAVFDAEAYARLRERGERRLSYAAFVAALMIMLYRDEPLLQEPYRLLTALVDIDESLTLWRYRHALMVQRMIGTKIGTGGSSGVEYLRRTVESHRVFRDLFNLSTYLVPRSLLPPLPADLARDLGFTTEE